MSSVREKVLEQYSSRVYKNRKEHVIAIGEHEKDVVTANTRAIPGIITQRGCCFAGCKGVVLGPIKDAAIIVHGPIGCAYYSWGTRRHKAVADEKNGEKADCYLEYCFSTDMQESDIVFGGEKKLKKAIEEVVGLIHPKCIFICSTCPVGLIGDDIHAVAKWAQEEYEIKCIAFSCEGYKGVSQSAGHHIANNQLIRYIIGTGDHQPEKKYSVNVLGEYNIGGDGWEVEKILKRCGIEVVSVFTGSGSYRDIKNAHTASLNLVQCHRSINYVADMMKDKYGMDWIKVNFIGIESCKKSLRDIGEYFGDEELKARIEAVIADEEDAIRDEVEYYESKLKGKTAALYVGGSRSHHYQLLLKDFGISTVLAGYEFAHRDDYEGREVIPDIKPDADSKNIESIEVEADPKFYRVYMTDEQKAALEEKGVKINYYEGMFKGMDEGAIICDDLNHFETEEFMKILKPDIFFSGIKDKFVAQKSGMLSRQLHSYDYSGPYAGFRGAVNFGRDLVMGLYTPAWSYVKAPWKDTPCIEGTLGGDEAC
ncbi:nitrogenase component I subunit alpha [Anaeromicropila populeti]|uniref:Nitrogenase protein alpha chain n=1 Tax=Anaeromicropila populeti TaxID=37658 RepID=A0A1I6HV66_9FIRM|nr:nitrogenase component I subunit alpha [Anaeromicropila populeti]SFR58333.1 nitrogenase molybdenum-iron protein alpha chain [Anaeromicropila populeti]